MRFVDPNNATGSITSRRRVSIEPSSVPGLEHSAGIRDSRRAVTPAEEVGCCARLLLEELKEGRAEARKIVLEQAWHTRGTRREGVASKPGTPAAHATSYGWRIPGEGLRMAGSW